LSEFDCSELGKQFVLSFHGVAGDPEMGLTGTRVALKVVMGLAGPTLVRYYEKWLRKRLKSASSLYLMFCKK